MSTDEESSAPAAEHRSWSCAPKEHTLLQRCSFFQGGFCDGQQHPQPLLLHEHAARTSEVVVLAVLKDGAACSLPAGMPSFQALYTQYFSFVWASTRRLGVAPDTIDDVVQEVFIVIHSRLHTLQHPEALRSWIYGVVRRTVSTHHRAQRARSSARATADGHELPSKDPTPFDTAQKTRSCSFSRACSQRWMNPNARSSRWSSSTS